MRHAQTFRNSTFFFMAAIVITALTGSLALRAQELAPGADAAGSVAYSAMSPESRWKDYVTTNFVQPGAYFQAFFTALGDETGNVPAEWGGGAAAFPKHFASQFARFTIGGTVNSSAAALLKEDTRFHSCHCERKLARATYAVSRTFLTYDDRGRTTPNIAGLAGIYSGPIFMTTWYPSRYTALGYGVRQGNLALGITAGIDLIREFSPQIKDFFHRKRPVEYAFR
jgi:hypothetical protein